MKTLPSVVGTILAHRARTVYGVMGEGNATAIDALTGAGAHYQPMRHETGAVCAADAHYRVTGDLAIATCTYGAGFTNALTGLAEAVKVKTPLILLTGGHDDPIAGWDILEEEHARSLGARLHIVDGLEAALAIDDEIEAAAQELRPLVIIMPASCENLQVDEAEIPRPHRPGRPGELTEQASHELDELARAISSASRPLVLFGRGAWLRDHTAPLEAFVEAADALVATTAAARHILDSERLIGTCGGFAPDDRAAAIASADLVIVFGASLNPFTLRHGRAFTGIVAQIDIDDGARSPIADTFIRADAAAAASYLAGRINRGGPAWQPRPKLGEPEIETYGADGRLAGGAVLRTIDEMLPAEKSVTTDGGHFIGWAAEFMSVPDPDGFTQVGTAFKCIGLGTSAAVGIAHARPERHTVLITGDGGLQMALADLATLSQMPGKVLVIVLNDAMYGAEVYKFGPQGLNIDPAYLPELDFAHMGRALGGAGLTITRMEDLDELPEALEQHNFVMVDVKCSQQLTAPYWKNLAPSHGED
ncbi:MAG: thiamine pyrophosphate-binding protein [Flaviflexus sp.]|nr:thiamine pyrophosphate-binding protein [Flaviflexus sp.]